MKRRFLRSGIMGIAILTAVATVGVFARLGGTGGAMAMTKEPGPAPGGITAMRLDLAGGSPEPSGNWYRVSGGAMQLHKTNKTGDTASNKRTASGDIEFSEINLSGPFVKATGARKDLLDWLNAWATGKGERSNATLELLDSMDQVVRTFNFFESIPVEYHPPAVGVSEGELLEERFVFKAERVEDVGGSLAGAQQTAGISPSAADVDAVITGRNFRFELDGKEIPLLSAEPGAFRLSLKDATMGSRKGESKAFTATKPEFGSWRIEKYFEQGKPELRRFFQRFATGGSKDHSEVKASLIYLDQNGQEARRIDCFGVFPVRYQFIDVDLRRSGAPATEVLEFSVARCEYQ